MTYCSSTAASARSLGELQEYSAKLGLTVENARANNNDALRKCCLNVHLMVAE
jgi:hypothetical protein